MMTSECVKKLKVSLIKHEGYLNQACLDGTGSIRIGVGYNLSERGISDNWILNQLTEDILFFYKSLNDEFYWFEVLNSDRKIVLIDMAFMGWKKFLTFKKMFRALERENYKTAAKEMLDSKWAKDVKERAIILADGMRTGVYEVGIS